MENNFDIKIEKSTKKIIILFLVFFGCILMFSIIYLIVNSDVDKKNILLNVDKHTRVVEIYPNKYQHNLGYVRFSNGSNEFLYYPYKVGDSLSKKKGDSIEYIFRNNNIIQRNLFEEAKKNGLLK